MEVNNDKLNKPKRIVSNTAININNYKNNKYVNKCINNCVNKLCKIKT